MSKNLRRLLWFLGGTAFVLVAVCLSVWLFRIERGDSSSGAYELHYRWGKPRVFLLDRNHDGVWDYRAIVERGGALSVPPSEFWDDEDFDGRFELHVLLGDWVDQDSQPVTAFEIDTDGNGTYETVLTGVDAEKAMRDWHRRRAFKYEQLSPEKMNPRVREGENEPGDDG